MRERESLHIGATIIAKGFGGVDDAERIAQIRSTWPEPQVRNLDRNPESHISHWRKRPGKGAKSSQ